MAEWSKAAVLKTVVSLVAPRVRIPISPPFFLFWKGARVAEWAPLLRECLLSRTVGSNPILSAIILVLFI